MFNPVRITLVILCCLSVVVPAVAQEEGTCEDALNAARAAYGVGELETAQAQVEQAVELCAGDRSVLCEAKHLKAAIENDLRQKVLDEIFLAAAPGKFDLEDYPLFMSCRQAPSYHQRERGTLCNAHRPGSNCLGNPANVRVCLAL
jgi:hypothetical protein